MSARLLAVVVACAAGCGDPESYYRSDAGSSGGGSAGLSGSGAAGSGDVTGTAGVGSSGTAGSGGAGGALGEAGATGVAGSLGGTAGSVGGAAGAVGTAGAIGSAGATGGAGRTGAAGVAGTAGAAGAAGAAGSAGVSGTAGMGGMGGMKVVTGACAGKVHVAAGVIDTFEEGALTNWYEYKDSTASATLNALAIVSPGAASTNKALHLSGSGFQGFGAGAGDMILCTDTSAFQGITFWAKGTSGTSNDIALQVAIPATQATADGGDCASACFDHPSKKVALTTAWQQYRVLFSDLAQVGFGAPAKYAGIIMALNWVSTEGPNVDFQIDEISYY